MAEDVPVPQFPSRKAGTRRGLVGAYVLRRRRLLWIIKKQEWILRQAIRQWN